MHVANDGLIDTGRISGYFSAFIIILLLMCLASYSRFKLIIARMTMYEQTMIQLFNIDFSLRVNYR